MQCSANFSTIAISQISNAAISQTSPSRASRRICGLHRNITTNTATLKMRVLGQQCPKKSTSASLLRRSKRASQCNVLIRDLKLTIELIQPRLEAKGAKSIFCKGTEVIELLVSPLTSSMTLYEYKYESADSALSTSFRPPIVVARRRTLNTNSNVRPSFGVTLFSVKHVFPKWGQTLRSAESQAIHRYLRHSDNSRRDISRARD